MEESTAKAIIEAAGSSAAAWLTYRAFWALTEADIQGPNDRQAADAIGAAYEARYGK